MLSTTAPLILAVATSSSGPAVASPRPSDGEHEEIVVNGYSSTKKEVPVETEVSEDQISSYGSTDVQNLLTKMSLRLGVSAEDIVVLVNGRSIGFDTSILDFPSEALDKIQLLSPEAASQFAQSGQKRLLNLVTKPRHSSVQSDLRFSAPTRGGSFTTDKNLNFTRLKGERRLNLSIRGGYGSTLWRSSRDLPVGSTYSQFRIILDCAHFQDVDNMTPHCQAGSSKWGTADNGLSLNPDRHISLMPSSLSFSGNAGLSQPIGKATLSVNVGASYSKSESQLGKPIIGLQRSQDSSSSDTIAASFVSGTSLRNMNETLGGNLNLNLNLRPDGWDLNWGLGYQYTTSRSLTDRLVSDQQLHQIIRGQEPPIHPSSSWVDAFVEKFDRNAVSHSLRARFDARKPILTLPAGPLHLALAAETIYGSQRADSVIRNSNVQTSVLGTVSIPIISQSGNIGRLIGAITGGVFAGANFTKNQAMQKKYGLNLSWSPLYQVHLYANVENQESVPNYAQLFSPAIVVPVYAFDYRTGSTSRFYRIAGGNPDLEAGRVQNVTVRATIRPMKSRQLTLTHAFQRTTSHGAFSAFPMLTPAIEEAFPERVTRDASGTLVSVDARPINLDQEVNESLSTTIAYAASIGRRVPSAVARKPYQLSLALNHRWLIKHQTRPYAGGPWIDNARGNGLGRHAFSFQSSIGDGDVGLSVDATWNAPASIDFRDSIHQRYHIQSYMNWNVAAFINATKLIAPIASMKALQKVQFGLNLQNVFGSYRRVVDAVGSVPPGYSQDEVDPLGRIIKFNVTSTF